MPPLSTRLSWDFFAIPLLHGAVVAGISRDRDCYSPPPDGLLFSPPFCPNFSLSPIVSPSRSAPSSAESSPDWVFEPIIACTRVLAPRLPLSDPGLSGPLKLDRPAGLVRVFFWVWLSFPSGYLFYSPLSFFSSCALWFSDCLFPAFVDPI